MLFIGVFIRIVISCRFWYENPHVFEPEQLNAIKEVTLARVICDSSDNIDRVQSDVFIMAENNTAYLPCKQIPPISLKVWGECCTGRISIFVH